MKESNQEATLPAAGERYSPSATAAAKAQTISNIVKIHKDLLRRSDTRIDLNDTDALQRISEDYFQRCVESGNLPSFAALAALTGYSRQNLYHFLEQHPETPSGILLEKVRAMYTAVRQAAADRGAADPAMSIFILKNSFQGFADKVEISPMQPASPLADLADEQATRRILEAIPAEDDE